jgi:VanZ family protein
MRFLKTWGPLLLWVALMAVISSIPRLHPVPSLVGWDSVFHLVQFSGFAALLYRALDLRSASAGRARTLVLIASATMVAVYEGHKLLVPGRHTSASDVVTDLFGAVAGLGLAQIIRWRA